MFSGSIYDVLVAGSKPYSKREKLRASLLKFILQVYTQLISLAGGETQVLKPLLGTRVRLSPLSHVSLKD